MGALKYESSDENVLTVDTQGQVTIKGTGSAEVSITMAEGNELPWHKHTGKGNDNH